MLPLLKGETSMDGKPNGTNSPRRTRRTESLEFDFARDESQPAAESAPVSPRAPETGEDPVSSPETTPKKQAAASAPNPNRSKPMASNVNPSISDFRKNAERQSREQKTVSGALAVIAYGLLAGLIFVACLAGFGGYVLWKQIEAQSVTVAQLDDKYKTQVSGLRDDLKATQEENDQLTTKFATQQQQVNQLTASLEETSAILRADRAQRARDFAALQARVKALETRR